MTDKIKFVLIGAIAGIAFFAGQYLKKPKIEIQWRERVVIQEVEKKREVRNVKTVKKPDGTVEILDTSTLDSFLQSQTEKETKAEKTESPAGSVLVQGLAAYQDYRFIYGAAASKRLLGPVTVGVFGFTDLRVGVSVGVEL